jgi:hypothetical protein
MTQARAGRLRLGWQYATPYPDPGPPPRRPTPPDVERLNPEWAAVQRREEKRLNRPLRAAVAVVAGIGVVLIALGAIGSLDGLVAGLGVVCCALVAAVGGYAIWQGERALRSRLTQERSRLSKLQAVQESQLFAWQAEHARRVRDWQALRVAYEHQKRWYAVCAPEGIQRVDIAGGTLPGWSAMLTTMAAHRLAAGGEVTVIDLSEGSVALDLLGYARARGAEPLVWVLPDDLPRLGLGLGLAKDALADVLSLAASVTETGAGSARELWLDNAILERIIDALGGTATVAGVAAALRALAQVGDPQDDMASGLVSAAQLDRLGAMFRRGATDRVVFERALVLEAQLRKLAAVGTAPAAPPRGALRVMALGRPVGADEGKMLGTYLAATLTHTLRGTQPGQPWQHTLFVLGADRLRDDTLDRLCGACQSTGTGLVLAFRAIPPRIRQRLGRGNAVVGFMRPGTAEDAKAVTEQLGTEHRFVLSQFTQTMGLSITDTTSGTYASTTGPAAGTGESEPVSAISAAISAGTAWGMMTAKAAGDGESPAVSLYRSRELVLDARELQQLPASAMVLSYVGPEGRQVILADANPGIGGLAAATEQTLEEFRSTPAVAAAGAVTETGGTANGQRAQPGPRPGGDRPQPNVGPPPPRLDWRKRRS